MFAMSSTEQNTSERHSPEAVSVRGNEKRALLPAVRDAEMHQAGPRWGLCHLMCSPQDLVHPDSLCDGVGAGREDGLQAREHCQKGVPPMDRC